MNSQLSCLLLTVALAAVSYSMPLSDMGKYCKTSTVNQTATNFTGMDCDLQCVHLAKGLLCSYDVKEQCKKSKAKCEQLDKIEKLEVIDLIYNPAGPPVITNEATTKVYGCVVDAKAQTLPPKDSASCTPCKMVNVVDSQLKVKATHTCDSLKMPRDNAPGKYMLVLQSFAKTSKSPDVDMLVDINAIYLPNGTITSYKDESFTDLSTMTMELQMFINYV